MVDPYAPPADAPARPHRPTPMLYETAAGTQAYQTTYEPPAPPADMHRERPWRRSASHEPHSEPARPGLFWVVASVGIGLLCLARLLLFFAVQDLLPNDQVAAALFAVLGAITLSVGLCLAAVLQRGLQTSWRAALMIGAGFFALVGLFGGPGGFTLL